MANELKTTNGTVTSSVSFDAAKQVIRDLTSYMNSMADGTDGVNARFLGAIAAAITVIGAVSSVGSLFKKKESTSSPVSVELEIHNRSSHVVVPWKSQSSKCSLKTVATPITPGESVSLSGYWHATFTDESQMNLVFVVGGGEKTIEVQVLLHFVESTTRWYIQEFVVDSTKVSYYDTIATRENDTLQAVSFSASEIAYPSFSVYSHSICQGEGKTYLVFTDLAG